MEEFLQEEEKERNHRLGWSLIFMLKFRRGELNRWGLSWAVVAHAWEVEAGGAL